MGKVFDAFMFFNELDVLELRLHELNSVVDHDRRPVWKDLMEIKYA